MTTKKRLLVLGASGMLGNTVLRYFTQYPDFQVYGSVRSLSTVTPLFKKIDQSHFFPDVDVQNIDDLTNLFSKVRPHIVVNCIGIVKQLSSAEDPLISIPINSLLPHRLARLAQLSGARLIHMSTDCVFSGKTGNYIEADHPDAYDLYGRSKLLGEVDYSNAITLRTSIIGHELNGSRSLIDWFLAQKNQVKGYKKAIFSGLPTVEIARIIHDYIIPNPELHGLYHVSAAPINKFDLLTQVAHVYGKSIEINSDETVIINRSLNSDRFKSATGYLPGSWDDLLQRMHDFL